MFPITPQIWYWLRPSASSMYALLLWNVGSRHDPPGKEGLLHFLEHTLFKGTRRRTGRAIFRRIESLGGDLNAFTTKDKMGIEVRIAPPALSTALSTLYELAHEATFPEKEVEREREVILEELAMYEDIPEESLLDHFEEQVFAEGGLRHPIIGYPDTVKSITADDLRHFYERYLSQSAFVLMLTGPLSQREIIAALRRTGWLERESRGFPPTTPPSDVIAPRSTIRLERSIQQAHLAIGGTGPALYDWAESLPLQMLLHELGGGMSSRLFLLLRERYGWGYTVYTFFHGYKERSVWGIYAGLTPESLTAARNLIMRELERLARLPLSDRRFAALRRGFMGRQALLWESPIFRLNAHARTLLDLGQLLDVQAWRSILHKLTPSDLRKAAQSAFETVYERVYVPKR